MKKRIISFLTSLVMVISLVGVVPSMTALAGNGLTWPVPGHTNLSRGYHSGYCIDISDSNIAGATIVAAQSGTVYKKYTCSTQHYGSKTGCDGFGTGLIIKGDDNRYYGYAHMRGGSIPQDVYQGAYISKGKKIGEVGTTGNSSGNHLHFYCGSTPWKGNIQISSDYRDYDNGHTCNSGRSVITTNPTCTSNGIRTYYCTVCGKATKTESISAYGHSYRTDFSGNYTKKTCTRCGNVSESWNNNYYDGGDVFYARLKCLCNGKYLGMSSTTGGTDVDTNGYNVEATSTSNTSLETLWKFEKTSDGYYHISSYKNNYCLDVFLAKDVNCANIQAYSTYSGNNNQQWRLYKNGSYFNLKPKHSNRCLDIYGGADTSTNANIYEFNGTNAQKFTLEIHNHNFSSWTQQKAPSCTTDGLQTRKCTSCGYEEKQTLKAKGHNYKTTTIVPTVTEKGYDLHTCSVCGSNYKDNYIDCPKVESDGWSYCSKLSSGITPNKYTIEYNNHYEQTQKSSPGTGWTNAGTVRTDWVNSGGVYYSNRDLSTSNSRVLVSSIYYHWCGPNTGTKANYEPTSKYVHYDWVKASTVSAEYKGEDNGRPWYFLYDSSGNRVYCQSGLTCDGAAGTHGKRAYSWYKENGYQDRTAVYWYKYTKDSGWVSSKDTNANSVKIRYKSKVCNHKYDNGVITKQPTCTATGIKTYTCSICKETKTETISKKAHSYSTNWTIDKAATCTAAGSKSHHCTVCGAKKDVTEVPATGHKFGDWTVTKEATETTEGIKTRKCSLCGKIETQSIPKTEKAYLILSTKTVNLDLAKNSSAKITVTGAGLSAKEFHFTAYRNPDIFNTSWGSWESNYTASFYLSAKKTGDYNISFALNNEKTGKEVYEEQVKVHVSCSHDYGEWKTISEPNCYQEGYSERKCSACGNVETKEIPATEHDYVDIVVKPTYSEEGYTLHICSICGDEYEDNYTDALKLDNVSGFKVSSTSANAVKLTWKKSSGANGYVVYRYNTSTKKYGRIAKITSNIYTDKKLKSGTSYKYAVRAYKTVNGKELLSPSYPQLTTSTNPATVSFKLSAGTKKATVKWSKITGASGYKVYYKTSKNGSWKTLKTCNNKTTSYTKTGLSKGRIYYFTVKAYRTVGGKTYNGAYTTKSVKIK